MLEIALEDARERACAVERLGDDDLLRAATAGDRQALGRFIQRHQQRVIRLAYRITEDWAQAQDLACEAFVRLQRLGERLPVALPVTTLLCRILVDLWDGRPRQPAQDTETTGSAVVDALHPFLQRETSNKVRRHLRLLPNRERLTVLLHRYEGLNQAQVAQVLGARPDDVESILSRAYARLGAALTGARVNAGRLVRRGCLAESQLIRLLSGELSAEGRSSVHAHMACCERCRERHRALEETWRQLDAWIVSPPTLDLAAQILPLVGRPAGPRWRALARAAAVILVVATAGSGPSNPKKSAATSIAHPTTAPVVTPQPLAQLP